MCRQPRTWILCVCDAVAVRDRQVCSRTFKPWTVFSGLESKTILFLAFSLKPNSPQTPSRYVSDVSLALLEESVSETKATQTSLRLHSFLLNQGTNSVPYYHLPFIAYPFLEPKNEKLVQRMVWTWRDYQWGPNLLGLACLHSSTLAHHTHT